VFPIHCLRRDGTERVEVPDNATVKVLKAKISTDLNIPQEQITLSIYQSLVSTVSLSKVAKSLGGGIVG
jgi:hypothetical protein